MTKTEINEVLEKHAIELSARMKKANMPTVDYAKCLDSLCHVFDSIRLDSSDPSRKPLFANSEESRE